VVLQGLMPKARVFSYVWTEQVVASVGSECLRNMAGVVKLEGYLFSSDIELDIRVKEGARPALAGSATNRGSSRWDPFVRRDWPYAWCGIGASNTKRDDW
jgi:hypothetical protein